MHHSLDHLLIPSAHAPPEALRRDVLRRTTQSLRWRRRVRQLSGIGVLVGVYLAGLLTVAALTPPEESAPTPPVVVGNVPPESLTPVALEWQALEQPERASRFYVQAADGYLGEGDPENAARCYANALSESGPEGLQVSTTDTWLFLAIKLARKKESERCVE